MISLLGRRVALRELQDAVDRYLEAGNAIARNQLDNMNRKIREMASDHTHVHSEPEIEKTLASIHE